MPLSLCTCSYGPLASLEVPSRDIDLLDVVFNFIITLSPPLNLNIHGYLMTYS
jgi:hypothetical protein